MSRLTSIDQSTLVRQHRVCGRTRSVEEYTAHDPICLLSERLPVLRTGKSEVRLDGICSGRSEFTCDDADVRRLYNELYG